MVQVDPNVPENTAYLVSPNMDADRKDSLAQALARAQIVQGRKVKCRLLGCRHWRGRVCELVPQRDWTKLVYDLKVRCPIGHWDSVSGAALQQEADAVSSEEIAGYEQRGNPEGTITRDQAKRFGFENVPCQGCENYTLVRSGTCFLCLTCGATTGCS